LRMSATPSAAEQASACEIVKRAAARPFCDGYEM
jgi:hypothetical protein